MPLYVCDASPDELLHALVAPLLASDNPAHVAAAKAYLADEPARRHRQQLRKIPTRDLRESLRPSAACGGRVPLRNAELWPVGLPTAADAWHQVEWSA